MTLFLYIMFYGWLAGAVSIAAFLSTCIIISGGRESFTNLFNMMQGKNYQPHHLDWAIVMSILFWPSSVSSAIFNHVVEKSVQNEGQ